MPTVGVFHRNFWKARANGVVAGGTTTPWMYPQWQASVITVAIVGPPLDYLQVLWARVRWWWRWQRQLQAFDSERLLVLHRVMRALEHPEWNAARSLVRSCANTPDFHHQDQWIAYGRAIRSNLGQAQNIYRHLKVVQGLQAATGVSNTDAHLLTQLAYEGFASIGRPRKIVNHPKRIIDHPKQVVAH